MLVLLVVVALLAMFFAGFGVRNSMQKRADKNWSVLDEVADIQPGNYHLFGWVRYQNLHILLMAQLNQPDSPPPMLYWYYQKPPDKQYVKAVPLSGKMVLLARGNPVNAR